MDTFETLSVIGLFLLVLIGGVGLLKLKSTSSQKQSQTQESVNYPGRTSQHQKQSQKTSKK